MLSRCEILATMNVWRSAEVAVMSHVVDATIFSNRYASSLMQEPKVGKTLRKLWKTSTPFWKALGSNKFPQNLYCFYDIFIFWLLPCMREWFVFSFLLSFLSFALNDYTLNEVNLRVFFDLSRFSIEVTVSHNLIWCFEGNSTSSTLQLVTHANGL